MIRHPFVAYFIDVFESAAFIEYARDTRPASADHGCPMSFNIVPENYLHCRLAPSQRLRSVFLFSACYERLRRRSLNSNKLSSLVFILLISHVVGALAQHPGVPGENAPGGAEVHIPSEDISIYGLLYRPKNLDRSAPGVVIVHGWAPYDSSPIEEDSYVAKEYAEAGYVALAITLRGWKPTGGKDDCGLKQPRDVANAAMWLSKQPGVNPEKIALRGQSLGGQVVLSAAALTNTVKATAAYFPITDFRLWGVTTNQNQRVKDDYIYGMCAEEGTPEDRSPLYTSDKVTGAVLLLHGENDKNVVMTHSKLMHQKMLESNQDVTLYVAKGGGHGSGGPGWENHNEIVYEFFREEMGD